MIAKILLLLSSAVTFFPLHSFLHLSALSLQEGQVLECSLINSIRVGAVPKVRIQCSCSLPTQYTSLLSLAPAKTFLVRSGETAW